MEQQSILLPAIFKSCNIFARLNRSPKGSFEILDDRINLPDTDSSLLFDKSKLYKTGVSCIAFDGNSSMLLWLSRSVRSRRKLTNEALSTDSSRFLLIFYEHYRTDISIQGTWISFKLGMSRNAPVSIFVIVFPLSRKTLSSLRPCKTSDGTVFKLFSKKIKVCRK